MSSHCVQKTMTKRIRVSNVASHYQPKLTLISQFETILSYRAQLKHDLSWAVSCSAITIRSPKKKQLKNKISCHHQGKNQTGQRSRPEDGVRGLERPRGPCVRPGLTHQIVSRPTHPIATAVSRLSQALHRSSESALRGRCCSPVRGRDPMPKGGRQRGASVGPADSGGRHPWAVL